MDVTYALCQYYADTVWNNLTNSMDQCDETKTTSSTCLIMRITGKITLTNLSMELAEKIKRKLELPNQSYEQAIRRNPRARFSLSPVIPYYEEIGEGDDYRLVVPRGVLENLRRYFEKEGIRVRVEDQRVSRLSVINTSIKLRPYQQGVDVEIARAEQGIVRCDTGYGKSIVALRVIERIGQRTLIIVPTVKLLNQFVYEIEQYTGKSAGRIQGPNFDIQDITVATAQTLQKRVASGELSHDEFGAIIVDECHGSITKRRIETIGYFSSRIRYGFTATARRTDGQGQAIKWIFGPIIVDKKIDRAKPVVEMVEFKGKIWGQEYHDMIAEQVENVARNELIVELAEREIQAGRKLLILTKRINHYEILEQQIKGPLLFKVRAGGKDTLLQDIKEGTQDFNALMGTFSLLGTGIDIPSLDTLIIAGDLKSDVLQEQAIGRILRLFDGKPTPKIIDIHDTGNGILRNQGRVRKQFYKQQDWKLV